MTQPKAGTQMEVPGTPPASYSVLEDRVNAAVADVQDAERALRAARVEERACRAALGRAKRA